MRVSGNAIETVSVLRGAPCGATWEAARRMAGTALDEACTRMGIETQYFCSANPAGWDPLHGTSSLHLAGELHSRALQKAVKKVSGL